VPPKLVYLTLCRRIQLLGLLARGDAGFTRRRPPRKTSEHDD
jgi:hypothetical protein